MSKLAKFFLPIILIVGAVIGASSGAEARCRGGYYGGCGQWGAWGWGPWGPGVGRGRRKSLPLWSDLQVGSSWDLAQRASGHSPHVALLVISRSKANPCA